MGSSAVPPPVFSELAQSSPKRHLWQWLALSLLIHLMIFAILARVEAGPGRTDSLERKSHGDEIGRRTRPLSKQPGSGDAEKGSGSMAPEDRMAPEAGKRVHSVQGRLGVKGRSSAGFSVLARRRGSNSVAAQARVNASGGFLLPLLPPGSYELSLVFEERVLSRVLVEIQAGSTLGLEWKGDLKARRIPAEEKVETKELTPAQFWELVRAPAARRWRRNLESMLSESGVSVAAIQAMRRAESRWLHLLELGRHLVRRLEYIGTEIKQWLTSAGIARSVNLLYMFPA